MSRVVKRSAMRAVKSDPSRQGRSQSASPLPRFIPPQLSQPVEKPPSGPQWLHEIKLDGFRMAARLGQIPSVPDIGLDAPIRAREERRPNRGRRFESRRSFLILVDPGTYRQPSCSDLVRGPSRIICRRNKSEPSLVSLKATWEIEIAGSGRKPIAVRNSERVRRYPDFLAGERL
jgi:hypothetical protein